MKHAAVCSKQTRNRIFSSPTAAANDYVRYIGILLDNFLIHRYAQAAIFHARVLLLHTFLYTVAVISAATTLLPTYRRQHNY